MRKIHNNNRRRPLSIQIVYTLLTIYNINIINASWIDPDTPLDARTTIPATIKVPPPQKTSAKTKHLLRTAEDLARDHANKAALYRKKHHHEPSPTPTYFPTFDPTSTPSEAPSSQTPPPTIPPRKYELVFSDEFNIPHRNFHDGSDPRWTAINKNDYTNDAQHYYDADNVFTDTSGNLVIKSESADTTIIGFNDVKYKKERVTKHFKSGMLQSWNKFCFTGGIMEAEISLPGKHNVGGLWPAFWMLGNLARHTYVGSSEHVWPWSSSVCTEKSKTAQLISACDRVEHYGMHTGVGRGAPEIDVFEVQAGNTPANTGEFLKMPVGQPFLSSSYQVAPGLLPRPGPGWWPGPGQWYNNLTGGMNTSLNIAFYGTYNAFRNDVNPAQQDYWSDAISYNRQLNSSHFGKFHKYRVEWELPDAELTEENNYTQTEFGYIRWFVDDEFILEIKGEGLNATGTGAEISSEPMYMLLNTAISSQWGFPSKCPAMCPCKTYKCGGTFTETCGFSEGFCDMLSKPAEYKVNWVRVYQDKNDPKQKVGCSTKERPTRKFIEAHKKKYMQAGDTQPLKPIQNGGGTCSLTASPDDIKPQSCGGRSRGTCQAKTKPHTCECINTTWTGPHCLNPVGYDDIIWDPIETLSDLGFSGPSLKGGLGILLIICTVAGILLVVWPMVVKRNRRDGYMRVRAAMEEVRSRAQRAAATSQGYEQAVLAPSQSQTSLDGLTN